MDEVEIGEGVSVSGFGDAVVAPAGIRVRRGRGAVPADVIDAALDAPDLTVAADVAIHPLPPVRRSRGAPPTAPIDPKIKVAVAPGEDAVLLLERDGSVYTWVYPDSADAADDAGAAAPARRVRGAETLVFSLGATAAPADFPASASGRRRSRRGIVDAVVDRLIEPIRVRVVRFGASAVIDIGLRRVEGDLVEGLVDMAGPASTWQPAGSPPAALATARRVLLMVHGTFSNTRGSFGALETTGEGRDFLAQVRGSYDAVIGFDHRTLGQSPRENALAMLDALSMLPTGVEIDTIAYSRGGLVQRSFTGLPGTGRFRFGRAVFVGCTNAGTHLAEPENWRALVDLYTNLLVAGSKVVDLATSGTGGAIAALAIRTIARFVQALPELAINENKVPGLAAMRPGGPVVQALAAAAQRTPPIETFVVRSDFEPRIDPARGITGALAEFLIDRVADRLIANDNDLVVDTASMADFGPSLAAPAGEALMTIAPADAVYHIIYFASPTVAAQLGRWLARDHRAAAPPSTATVQDASPRPVRRSRGVRSTQVFGQQAPDASAPEPAAPAPLESAAAATAVAPSPAPTPDSCYFAAEMDPVPALGLPTPVFVSVSREQIVVAANRAAAATATPAPVNPVLPITLSMIALENCCVLGESTIDIPVPDKSDTLRFLVQGVAPGVARIQLEASQGAHPLVSLLIEPVFVADADGRLTVAARALPNVTPAGSAAVLRIYEQRQQDGTLLLRYDMSGKGLTQTREVLLPASFRMDAFVGDFLARLDGAYGKTKPEYTLFLKRIRDFAIDSTNQLMPREIRALLWQQRAKIDAVHVIAESPYVPWELLYIDDPEGGGPDTSGFLCEWGLVRWTYNARWPGDTLHLRSDRVRYVIPDYLDRNDQLPQATRERDMLLERFPGARPVVASSDAVGTFLRDDAAACDLLHFACHGEALQAAVLNSDLVLAGVWNDDRTVAEDLLGSSTVKRMTRFDPEDASGFVFINACQTGRPGEGIAGVTGFADAFLRPMSGRGAAGFVGALWSVDDTLALSFAQTFYDRLLAGDTLVQASKEARKAARDESDFTWLAYSVYGNPFARIASEATSPPG